MINRTEPESREERTLRVLVSSTMVPEAPSIPSGLPARLAERARRENPVRIDLPLAAAVCSAAALLLLALLPFLSMGRTDLRWWMAAVPAVNLILSPIAAFVVVRTIRREALDVET